MSVSSRFDKATKRIAVAGALAVTALFPNLAAALDFSSCVTPKQISDAKQFVIASTEMVDQNRGVPTGLMMLTTNSSLDLGYVIAQEGECFKIKSEYTNIQINDPATGRLPLSFLQSSAGIRTKLANAYTNAAIPMLQADVVRGEHAGNVLTLLSHANPVPLSTIKRENFQSDEDFSRLKNLWSCPDRKRDVCNLPGSLLVSNNQSVTGTVTRNPAFGASEQAAALLRSVTASSGEPVATLRQPVAVIGNP